MGIMAKLTIQLVVWNGAKHLPSLFDSLFTQTFQDWDLLVLDNASSDESIKIIEDQKVRFPSLQFFSESKNTGFSGGHNILFQKSNSEFILVLNQDVVFGNDVLAGLVDYLVENTKVASVSPRLMRTENNVKEGIIDSLGLTVDRRRRFSDRKAGESWSMQSESATRTGPCFVFGISATVAMYRREAVRLATGGRLFDQFYFSYQEDIDLAWQLQLKGYDSVVLLDRVAYHERGVRDANRGILSTILNKQNQSEFVRYYSYRNHLATLLKNERWQNFLLDSPWILWYELMKLVYILIFDRRALKGLRELWNERDWLRIERKRIQSGAVISWKKIGQWMYM